VSSTTICCADPARGWNSALRREHGHWIVNNRVAAPVLVGAGGHWCPVARLLNATPECEAVTPEHEALTPEREASAERRTRSASGAVVVAQETEFPIAPEHVRAFTTAADTPELYFTSDLKGYGWIFRKQDHVNIGVGSLNPHACPTATVAFVDELRARGVVPPGALKARRWRGHAYRLSQPGRSRASSDGVLLAGDAVGLAYPQSGEGIRPAIESGLLAASTIIDACNDYSAERLAAYDRRLATRFGDGRSSGQGPSRLVPEGAAVWLGVRLLAFPWLVRHVVLDRWFLRTGEPALTS
jgi:flavin-dependent dehydrogenase